MNANCKEQGCIDLLRHLEETHPVSAIAKQAANLRFIMEAPKLEVGEDEKVSVPVLDLDSNKCAPCLASFYTGKRLINTRSTWCRSRGVLHFRIYVLLYKLHRLCANSTRGCLETSEGALLCRPRSGRVRQPVKPIGAEAATKKPQTLEEEFWENYQPPSYARNKYVWAAAVIIGSFAAWYSIQYKDCIPF